MNKYTENALKASIPVALIGALAFAIPVFVNEGKAQGGFESIPEIKNDISFVPLEVPQGFTIREGQSTKGFAALKSAQSPGAWLNESKTCRFTPTVEMLAEDLKGQEESFLSKKYIYDEAEKYDFVQSETKTIALKRNNGDPVGAFYASYEIPNDSSLSDDINSGNYYRTTVARVIAQQVPFAEDSNIPNSKNRKGTPVVVLNYDCLTKEAFKENEFSRIASSIVVDLETDHNHEVPVAPQGDEPSSVIDDPSDDLTYGYTVIPEKFDNPLDVVDRNRGRGATDTSEVKIDQEQVQVTAPAWQE